MVIRALIAVLLGLLVFFVCGLFAPHIIAVLAGVLAGLWYFFGDGRGRF